MLRCVMRLDLIFRIRKQSRIINYLRVNTVNDTTQDHDGGLSAKLENQILGNEPQLYEEIEQQGPSSLRSLPSGRRLGCQYVKGC